MNVSIPRDDILEPFYKFYEKRTHALMGPSGCGKTTLLNRIFKRYDNVAYVPQEPPIDAFKFLTTRECVALSVELYSNDGDGNAVEELIEKMELTRCADTLLMAASGGEKKRCSIAMELCQKPIMFLFDEPFSSLDSRSTVMIFGLIQNKLSDMPVLITVHQPSGYLFFNFSDVMFMKGGRVLYEGRPDNAQHYFEMLGFIRPSFSSVPEFIIDVCQQMDINAFPPNDGAVIITDTQKTAGSTVSSGWLRKIKPLIVRECTQNVRNPSLLKTKVIQSATFGIFVGLLYLRTGNDQIDVQNKTGAMFFMIINQVMSNVFSTVDVFPSNLEIFKYDYERNKYPLFMYYFIKTTIDVPFVVINTMLFSLIAGFMTNITPKVFELACVLTFVALSGSSLGYLMSSISEQYTICLLVSNLCVLPMMLTSGFFINNQSVPVYMSWIQAINPFYFGYNAMSYIVWDDVTIRCDDRSECPYPTGKDVMEYQGTVRTNNVSTLFGIIILYRTLGYVSLCVRFSGTRV